MYGKTLSKSHSERAGCWIGSAGIGVLQECGPEPARGWASGDARQSNGSEGGPGQRHLRLCGDIEVARLGRDYAAGRGTDYADPGALGRPGRGGQGVNGHRSTEAAGHGEEPGERAGGTAGDFESGQAAVSARPGVVGSGSGEQAGPRSGEGYLGRGPGPDGCAGCASERARGPAALLQGGRAPDWDCW